MVRYQYSSSYTWGSDTCRSPQVTRAVSQQRWDLGPDLTVRSTHRLLSHAMQRLTAWSLREAPLLGREGGKAGAVYSQDRPHGGGPSAETGLSPRSTTHSHGAGFSPLDRRGSHRADLAATSQRKAEPLTKNQRTWRMLRVPSAWWRKTSAQPQGTVWN